MSVLVIEDNRDLAFAVASALESEGFEVIIAESGPEGVEKGQTVAAEVIILDLMLPGFDGFRVLRTLRSSGVETPILILTAKGEEDDKVKGFRLGADDYVTKPFGDVEVNRASRTVERAGEPVALSPKEYDLLLALMNRSGAVMTRHELLTEVWGYQSDVSTRTVDIHVSELRKKLEKKPAEPKHILTVRKTGYRFEP
jgi:two-component system alkaline phosphatase synthesis response regulator PhoP